MRYINLLDKTSRVKTRRCFVYNTIIFFAVPKRNVSRAIGPAAINVKKLQAKLGKRIRIIAENSGIKDAKRFISDIVEPVKIKSLEIKDGKMIVSADGMQNKAMLFGRNKRRFFELKKIVQDIFGMELKIV